VNTERAEMESLHLPMIPCEKMTDFRNLHIRAVCGCSCG
jgi:hypothetical protein